MKFRIERIEADGAVHLGRKLYSNVEVAAAAAESLSHRTTDTIKVRPVFRK
tara:strand:+ start:2012 stop:2164 length:153 start_codon:yes stop_codon:yes gene_type:complete